MSTLTTSSGAIFDPDPLHIIERYCNTFTVREFKKKNTSQGKVPCSVVGCNEHFQDPNEKQMNCRLCGEVVCKACALRLWIPSQFKQKGRPGASYVCMGCREICLDLKQKDEVKLLSADPDYKRVAPPKLRNYDEKKRVVYPLERFQHPNHMKLNGCFLCHVRDQKEIPCRICGRNCDINCVRTDPSMPDCFEIDPTHNTHRKSVCLECRYFKSIKGITYATERRVEAKDDKKREKSKSIATPTSRPRARMRKRGEQNFPDPSTLPTGEIQLNVQWEGATRTIGAITVDADANLQVINDVFMSEFKQNQLFHYLCRGKGVHPEWWDIFTAKYLHPTVIIRAGTVRTPTIMLGGSADQSSGAGGSTTVPQENNPYLTARRVKKADGASAVELEEVIPEAQFAFAKPSIEGKSFARRFTAPARTAKVVVKAAPKVQVSEGDLNAILARRAKEVFGALT